MLNVAERELLGLLRRKFAENKKSHDDKEKSHHDDKEKSHDDKVN